MKRMIKLIAAALGALCIISGPSFAQTKDDKPYNLQKAYAVLRSDRDEEQALRLLGDQLKSTPDNVECWMLMCRIYRNRHEYGRAMASVNEAIKVNKPKRSGYPNSTLYWWKASVYDDMENDELELEWLNRQAGQCR